MSVRGTGKCSIVRTCRRPQARQSWYSRRHCWLHSRCHHSRIFCGSMAGDWFCRCRRVIAPVRLRLGAPTTMRISRTRKFVDSVSRTQPDNSCIPTSSYSAKPSKWLLPTSPPSSTPPSRTLRCSSLLSATSVPRTSRCTWSLTCGRPGPTVSTS